MTPYLPASSDEFGTPPELFAELHEEFQFTIDACASELNSKLPSYVNKEVDAFSYDFEGHRVWCNPPYNGSGTVAKWAQHFKLLTGIGKVIVAVLLVPTKTEQPWFHELCLHDPYTEVRFVKGRIKFVGGAGSARDSHMILIFRKPRKYT